MPPRAEDFASKGGDKPALVFWTPSGTRLVTGNELLESAEKIALTQAERWLLARERRRPIAIIAEATLEAIAAFVGCFRSRTPVLFIHPREPETRREAIVKETGALSLDSSLDAPASPALPALPEGTMLALGTSGSTGVPKWVLHSWESLRASVTAHTENLPWAADGDRWLLSIPFSHVGGFGVLFRCLLDGQTVVIANGLSPKDTSFDRALEDTEVSLVSMVPTQLGRWIERTTRIPPSLRKILVGGARLPENTRERARRAGWPLLMTYGMTEFGSQVSTERPNEPGNGVGRPLGATELRLDAEGRIHVRGPTGMLGYWGHPAPVDADGWFRTNDAGRWDARGHLLIDGRLDQLIISGVENVAPEMVEEAALSTGLVSLAVAKGRADEDWGQRIVLFAVPAPNEASEGLVERLEACLRKLLPSFAIPKEFELRPELPTLPSGKIARADLV